MINVIILINLALGILLWPILGCQDESSKDPSADASISGEEPQPVSDDPLKDLADQGKLPNTGEGDSKLPVITKNLDHPVGSGLSLFPPNVDADQDNIPEVAIPNHPEIKLDNCPGVFNPTQDDSDSDGIGDACK